MRGPFRSVLSTIWVGGARCTLSSETSPPIMGHEASFSGLEDSNSILPSAGVPLSLPRVIGVRDKEETVRKRPLQHAHTQTNLKDTAQHEWTTGSVSMIGVCVRVDVCDTFDADQSIPTNEKLQMKQMIPFSPLRAIG